jgi:hypothetical protein
MSNGWTGGSTRRWRKVRAAVLLANAQQHRGRCRLQVGTMCQRHGRPCPGVCTGLADSVHHARGKAAGDDPRYLVACCAACNLHIGQPGAASPEPTPRSNW